MIFIAISVIVIAFLALAGFILAFYDRIAIAHRHPEADAVADGMGRLNGCRAMAPRIHEA